MWPQYVILDDILLTPHMGLFLTDGINFFYFLNFFEVVS